MVRRVFVTVERRKTTSPQNLPRVTSRTAMRVSWGRGTYVAGLPRRNMGSGSGRHVRAAAGISRTNAFTTNRALHQVMRERWRSLNWETPQFGVADRTGGVVGKNGECAYLDENHVKPSKPAALDEGEQNQCIRNKARYECVMLRDAPNGM